MLTEGDEVIVEVLGQNYRGRVLSVDAFCYLPVKVQYTCEAGQRIERFSADEVYVSPKYFPAPETVKFGLTPTLARARFCSRVPAILKGLCAQA